MDVIEELLAPKKVPEGFNSQKWEHIQRKMVDAVLGKHGTHSDEFMCYDSYLDQFRRMVSEHLNLGYVDDDDRYHTITVEDLVFYRPSEGSGLDNPETAALRGNYESILRGTVVYTIYEKEGEVKSAHDPMEEEEKEEEVEDVDHIPGPDDDEDDAEGDDDEEEEDEKKGAFHFDQSALKLYTKMLVQKRQANQMIVDVPVFLRTGLCHLGTALSDPRHDAKPWFWGGSYLVGRNFKICPYEETMVNNWPISTSESRVELWSRFKDDSKVFRTNSTIRATVEWSNIRKMGECTHEPRFRVEIPHEKSPKKYISLSALSLCYGWTPDELEKAVLMYIGADMTKATEPKIALFMHSLRNDYEGCKTQTDAIHRMSKYLTRNKTTERLSDRMSYTTHALRTEFFPNLNVESDDGFGKENLRKGFVLAEIASELIMLSEHVNEDVPRHLRRVPMGKRSYVYKRLDTPGNKMAALIRKYVRHGKRKGKPRFEEMVKNNQSIDIDAVLCRNMIKLTGSVKNGNFDSRSDPSDSSKNKTQLMVTGFCSSSLRTQTQTTVRFAMKKNCDTVPLMVDLTQAGRIDAYRTPESGSCGISRNKAAACYVTAYVDFDVMEKIILQIIEKNVDHFGWRPVTADKATPPIEYSTFDPTIPRNPDDPHEPNKTPLTVYTPVFDLDNGIIGWSSKPFNIYKTFVGYRRRGVINTSLSLHWDRVRGMFRFNVDPGRMMRPLVVMDNFCEFVDMVHSSWFDKDPDPFRHMINCGVIEYLDAAEEYCGLSFTADSFDTAKENGFEQTHMELHAALMQCTMESGSHCNNDQGPRRMYTFNMNNRAMSMTMFDALGTTTTHTLHYGQVPLQSTLVDKALHNREREPSGINGVVAVIATPNNIEDAYTMNKASVERGLLMSSSTRADTVTTDKKNTEFKRPGDRCRGKASSGKYDHLNPDGIPDVGTDIPGGYPVVGKVYKDRNATNERCLSRFLPINSRRRVKSVERYPKNSPSPSVVRVRSSKVNEPQIGNKFFMHHGQKGTAGDIVSPENLPWFADGPMAGVSPDLFINPCSLSRITQGLLLEAIAGKAYALRPGSIRQYSTTFLSKLTFNERLRLCMHVLRSNGSSYTGKSRMRQGTTGELIECMIFSGLIYVSALKQLSSEKLRARVRGPVNELTRQTSVGAKNFGGQKVGEMERWNLNSHGVSKLGQNFVYEAADKFHIYWCNKCEIQAFGCKELGFYMCNGCKSRDDMVQLLVPYVSNLMQQETMAAGLGHKFVTRKVENLTEIPENMYEREIYDVEEEDEYGE